MNRYLKIDKWCIIEEGFDPENHEASESIFSLGNGRMGQRANFEERYSGPSLQGSYIAGVYYPDKTRVGWWKNGYPEYFAKVINSPCWIGIDVKVNDTVLDLAEWTVEGFKRVLDMYNGILTRSFIATSPSGDRIEVNTFRFLSMANPETGVVKYSVKPLTSGVRLTFTPYIDANVRNRDANYDEQFWSVTHIESQENDCSLVARTNKLDFQVGLAMQYEMVAPQTNINHYKAEPVKTGWSAGNRIMLDVAKGDTVELVKYVAVLSNLDHPADTLQEKSRETVRNASFKGFNHLLTEHTEVWRDIWANCDIEIGGDDAAQQGIRFNIFHLNQTYRGDDPRLNIGPKGFTGEKYGGVTYWDTEAYCVPFFLSTTKSEVTRNLLVYRYKHLNKAIENAKKLGFTNGAALYPMVTINGEECHNEWEITFEEIHRNGAIAFAIYRYVNYTGDFRYIPEYGLEALIGISRFWSQRVSYSEPKQKYVILGVTGPNEYENNVNNNWYTNTIACWCLEYTLQAIAYTKENDSQKYHELVDKLRFDEHPETHMWQDILQHMYFPVDNDTGIFLQQEGYMDKEQKFASELESAERPINQRWSWDRILRSCFIKQADVLQGLYFLEERYDRETIQRNFDFYEPRTVHESSLSPCIHSIIAAKLGYTDRAYELYLRTSRLDLDDYNHEVHEGLHITSMAGTWMSIVEGLGGMRVRNGKLCFHPVIPHQWESYSFKIEFRNTHIRVKVTQKMIILENISNTTIECWVNNMPYQLRENAMLEIGHCTINN